MKTLIELYDERPLENVLATQIFRPETTVFICRRDIAADTGLHARIREYMTQLGVSTDLVFAGTDTYQPQKILETMQGILAVYEDCGMDITGGSEAALFAAGRFSAQAKIPVFTYSRKQNRFFNISGASFVEDAVCDVHLTVSQVLSMAGGAMKTGRVDNDLLQPYLEKIPAFFDLYLKNRARWVRFVTWMQEASQKTETVVKAGRIQKGERGARLDADMPILEGLAKIGWILDLSAGEEKIFFRFPDMVIRSWLRDIGSVLELFVYNTAFQTGLFDDVRLSVVAKWDANDSGTRDAVSNEIDVMMTYGVIPVFISCKTSEIHTEALNELAILRDRFGGEMAKAAIVSGQKANAAVRNRAAELGIRVFDLEDLKKGRLEKRLTAMVR